MDGAVLMWALAKMGVRRDAGLVQATQDARTGGGDGGRLLACYDRSVNVSAFLSVKHVWGSRGLATRGRADLFGFQVIVKPGLLGMVHGYLAHKKPPPLRRTTIGHLAQPCCRVLMGRP